MKTIINIIRYLVACFFLFGFFAILFNLITIDTNKVTMAITFLILSISFAPFVYQLIFKNSNMSNKSKITVQIVTPIIAFVIMSAIIGFSL